MPIKKVLDPKLSKQLYNDNWRIRRRWLRRGMIILVLNAQWVLIYTMIKDSAIGVQVLMTLIGAIMSIFMIYVFGAVWDDSSKRQTLNNWMNPSSTDEGENSEEDDDTNKTGEEKDIFLPTPGAKKDTE